MFSETPFPALHLPKMAIQAELRAERLVLPNGLELATVQASGSSGPDRIDVSQLDFGLARGSFNVSGAGNRRQTVRGAARALQASRHAASPWTRCWRCCGAKP